MIGHVVVTKDADGQIVSVIRQDKEGRVLSVISTSAPIIPQPWLLPGEDPNEEVFPFTSIKEST